MSKWRVLSGLLFFVVWAACRDTRKSTVDSARASLPPVFPGAPVGGTNWDENAGALLVVSAGSADDSALIVLPDVSDSTIAFLHGTRPQLNGMSVDLFGRSGKIASSETLTVVSAVDSSEGCFTWPAAKLHTQKTGWAVGFASGHVDAIPLDSIEAMNSVDSAALAALLTQNASTLPVTADPVFRGLPFRIRSAYTFRLDSVAGVVADVIRSVNEEATPRLEHLLFIGEKPASSPGKYSVVYFNRTAGAEESTQVTELLALVAIGKSKEPAAVISVEYGDGGRYELLTRIAPSEWRTMWRSAFTGC
jgi:hypothetical protein